MRVLARAVLLRLAASRGSPTGLVSLLERLYQACWATGASSRHSAVYLLSLPGVDFERTQRVFPLSMYMLQGCQFHASIYCKVL